MSSQPPQPPRHSARNVASDPVRSARPLTGDDRYEDARVSESAFAPLEDAAPDFGHRVVVGLFGVGAGRDPFDGWVVAGAQCAGYDRQRSAPGGKRLAQPELRGRWMYRSTVPGRHPKRA
ncbi:MAG: hypothetical protein KGO50_02830 [Myxococcales bacterium]|nr:hypothetical protein [Myxococcales bacterium]